MYTGGVWGAMISVFAPASVGEFIAVLPWPVLCVLVGICVTVTHVPMFSVAHVRGCLAIYSHCFVIQWLTIFFMFNMINIFQTLGVRVGAVGGVCVCVGVSWDQVVDF